jgi:hypothetical protein
VSSDDGKRAAPFPQRTLIKGIFQTMRRIVLAGAACVAAVAAAHGAESDSQYTLRCSGGETNKLAQLANPGAAPVKGKFSVDLTFDLGGSRNRVFISDERRWVDIKETTEFRIAFEWHSDLDNIASVDRITDGYRYVKVKDRDHVKGRDDVLITRIGSCTKVPYVKPAP